MDWKMFFASVCTVPFITSPTRTTSGTARASSVQMFVTNVMRNGRARYKPYAPARAATAAIIIPGLPSGFDQNDFGEKLDREDGGVLIFFLFVVNSKP